MSKFKYGDRVKIKDDFYKGLVCTVYDYEDASGIYGRHDPIYRYFLVIDSTSYYIKNSIAEQDLAAVK